MWCGRTKFHGLLKPGTDTRNMTGSRSDGASCPLPDMPFSLSHFLLRGDNLEEGGISIMRRLANTFFFCVAAFTVFQRIITGRNILTRVAKQSRRRLLQLCNRKE